MSKAAPASLERRLRRATNPSTASSASATTIKIRAARLAYDHARKSAIETKARATLISVIRFGDIKDLMRKNDFQSACPRRRFAKSSGAIAFRPSMRVNIRVIRRRIFMTAGIFLLNCGAERPSSIVLRFMPKTLHKNHKESIGFLLVATALRSEEHTSELQSLRHLVCRLLLEK